MDPVATLREWIARAVELDAQVALSSPASTVFVHPTVFDALVRKAVETECERCIAIVAREVRESIDDGATDTRSILGAIRRAELAIREGA